MASTILDLPQPFGPTIPDKPSWMVKSAGSAKDLNPMILRWLKCKALNFHQLANRARMAANSS